MEETPEAQIKRHIEDCATLLAKLECQLPNPALEWPVALLRHALEENRKALRQMNQRQRRRACVVANKSTSIHSRPVNTVTDEPSNHS